MTVKQIAKDTGLRPKQVYVALRELANKNYIKKRLEKQSGYRSIKIELFSRLSNIVLAEKSLKKWGAL